MKRSRHHMQEVQRCLEMMPGGVEYWSGYLYEDMARVVRDRLKGEGKDASIGLLFSDEHPHGAYVVWVTR